MKNATLTRVRAVKGGKYEIEISQVVGKTTNLLALLNVGDDRFNQAKARKAWMVAEPSQIEKYFAISCKDIKVGSPVEVSIENPMIEGLALSVQITETNTPSEYQKANALASAKQYVNKDGVTQYLRNANGFIFSNSTIVLGEAKHTFLAHTALVPLNEAKAQLEEVAAAAPLAAAIQA